VAVRRVPTRDGAFTAEDIVASCDETTRLVSVSLVAFHTGFRAPVEEIGGVCRSRRIVFGLDAIQAVGAQRVDVADWNVDFLSADGHKWMLGPEGCGILFTTPELRGRLAPPPGWTNLERAHGADFRVPPRPAYRSDGVRFEPGALPTPGLYALAASLGLLLEVGLPEVERRIARTLDVLVEGLPTLGFSPVLFGGPPRSGILAARPPAGKDARYFQKRLADEDTVVSAREGFLRFSPHVGNDEAEAERVLGLLKRL
jgi:selenocysteine lyase/cysteine desulfurase